MTGDASAALRLCMVKATVLADRGERQSTQGLPAATLAVRPLATHQTDPDATRRRRPTRCTGGLARSWCRFVPGGNAVLMATFRAVGATATTDVRIR